MEKIKYQLSDGTVCYQDELIGKQDVAILKLASKIQLDEKTFRESTLITLMELLVKNDILADFFSIILTDESGRYNCEEIKSRVMNWKNSEYERIVKDFFALNPSAMNLLKNFVPKLGSMNSTQTSRSTETKSENEVTTGGVKEKLS